MLTNEVLSDLIEEVAEKNASATRSAFIGISGWRYPEWRGSFYPKGLVQSRELQFASEHFNSIEINGSFYGLQRHTSYLRWKAETPPGFVFAVKGHRLITHVLSLRNCQVALANFFASGVLALQEKLGPILWQLPERVTFNAEALEKFCALLPHTTISAVELATHNTLSDDQLWIPPTQDSTLRHSLEVRHPSFDTVECYEILRQYGIAMVIADTAGRWPLFYETTLADFVYVRLHGAEELYVSGYSEKALDAWATKVEGWRNGVGVSDTHARDVYVYFDNTAKVRAPFDAMSLRQRLGH